MLVDDKARNAVSAQNRLPAPRTRLATKNFWLSTALNTAADAIVIVDASGRVRFINPVAQRLTGFLPLDAVGEHYLQILAFEYRGSPVKDDLLCLATFNEEPLSLGQELVLVSRDGRRREVEAEISSGTKASGAFGSAVFTFRDITQRRWEEHQRRQEQAIRAVERLAETTAHTLNNLLTAILGNGELLLNTPDTTEAQLEFLGPIVGAAQDAAGVVRQLSAISRVKFATRRDLCVNRFLEEFLPVLLTSVPPRIQVRLELAEPVGPVSADPNQLEQIVYNLVKNAADAIPAEGEIVIGTHTARVESAGIHAATRDFVCLRVADTGEGMSDETQERIFEPFFSLRKDGTHPGLGVSIAQGIVRDYKGFLNIKSALGAGTEITFGIPCIEADPFAYLDQTTPKDSPGTLPTILLIEDDHAVRRMVRQVLEKHGHQVIEASTGDEALSLASLFDGRLDLAIVDFGIPGISGAELVHRLGAVHPEAKVLLISGFSAAKIYSTAPLPSTVELLKKPFTHQDLLARIDTLIARRAEP